MLAINPQAGEVKPRISWYQKKVWNSEQRKKTSGVSSALLSITYGQVISSGVFALSAMDLLGNLLFKWREDSSWWRKYLVPAFFAVLGLGGISTSKYPEENTVANSESHLPLHRPSLVKPSDTLLIPNVRQIVPAVTDRPKTTADYNSNGQNSVPVSLVSIEDLNPDDDISLDENPKGNGTANDPQDLKSEPRFKLIHTDLDFNRVKSLEARLNYIQGNKLFLDNENISLTPEVEVLKYWLTIAYLRKEMQSEERLDLERILTKRMNKTGYLDYSILAARRGEIGIMNGELVLDKRYLNLDLFRNALGISDEYPSFIKAQYPRFTKLFSLLREDQRSRVQSLFHQRYHSRNAPA